MFRSFALALAALAFFASDAGAQYFKDRTITLVVGYVAGGPQDLTARVFASHLTNNIAGKPNVIVSNMAGASAVRAHNHVFEGAKGDGETVLWVPWYPIGQILDAPGVRFKYEKFAVLGMFHVPGFFVYGRTDAAPGGLKSGADIVKASSIKFAGGSPTAGYDLHATLSFKLLELPYTHITGYRGSAPMRAAVMKGEANFAADVGTTIPAVLDETLFKPGIAKVLYGFPMLDAAGKWVKDPTLAAYPTVMEVYKQVKGKEPSGVGWDMLALVMKLYTYTQMLAAPPSTPKPVVDELRRGYVATLADPAFKADYGKRFAFVPEPAPQAAVDATIASISKVEPRLIAALRAHVEAQATPKQ